jgi:hypothetical protein
MRKLVEATLVSLDGVVGSPEEWALPYWDEENKDYAHAQLAEVDAFLLGRVTYENFVAAWSQVSGDPYIDTINRMPKFVASASLREMTWNATPITGDVVERLHVRHQHPGLGRLRARRLRRPRPALGHPRRRTALEHRQTMIHTPQPLGNGHHAAGFITQSSSRAFSSPSGRQYVANHARDSCVSDGMFVVLSAPAAGEHRPAWPHTLPGRPT